MEEENREFRKSNDRSKKRFRRVSEKSNDSKSKDLNPIEKRNQRIEENKKKGFRVNNSQLSKSFKNSRSDIANKSKSISKKGLNHSGEKISLKKKNINEGKSISARARKSAFIVSSGDSRHVDYGFFGLGLIMVYLLLLMSSFDTVISEGLFFIYLGVLLLRKPRIKSQSTFINIFAVGIILYSLFGFFPFVSYFSPDWRNSALNEYGISLGFFKTILPMKSMEALLILVASIMLYYHMACWKLNNAGRKFLFVIIIGVTIFSGCVQYLFGNNLFGLLFSNQYQHSPIKHYIENLNLIYFIGGLSSMILFFDSYRSNTRILIVSPVGLFISIFFLIQNEATFYFVLFYVVTFLYIVRLFLKGKPRIQKSLIWIFIISFFGVGLYLNQIWLEILIYDLGGIIYARWNELYWLLVGSFKELNIFGNGIATAHSILPQLSPVAYFKNDYAYRGSDLLTYISDFGFIGLVALILFFNYWLFRYLLDAEYSKIRHRFFYATVVMVFLIRFLLVSKSTSVGLLVLMLLFLHLSLRNEKEFTPIIPKSLCQLIGVFWLSLGVFWVSVSFSNQPFHSDICYRLSYAEKYNANLDFKDLSIEDVAEKEALVPKTDPSKYFLKSYQLLESKADKEAIIRTLYQTTFFDRNNSKIFLHLGYLLSDYDLDLATDAWIAYFDKRPLSKIEDYKALIYYSKNNYELLLSLEKLSYLANEFSVEFALSLNRLDFQKYIEFNALDKFFISNKNSQFLLLKRFLEEGFFEKYNTYITKQGDEIRDVVILEAIKEKELANFDKALFILRKFILPERIDIYQVKDDKRYIPRVFLQNYPDVEMGVVLMKREIHAKNYDKALIYVEHILTMPNPPKYAYYWRAELLYRMKDYVDSWFAFVTYLEKANVRQFSNKR